MFCNLVLSLQAYEHIAIRFCRSLPFQDCDLSRSVSPITAELTLRYHVHMKMWCELTSNDAVILY